MSSTTSNLFQLLLFSVFMFLGSYISGLSPMLFSLSEERLKRVSVVGAGLLIGTALAVIIPEGVQTLIKAYPQHTSAHLDPVDKSSTSGDGGHAHEHAHDPLEGLDRAIGVSLVLGFLFMLLIDQIASSRSGQATPASAELGGASVRKPSGSPVTWTTTLGLVVHAAADGVALGAAATTNQTDVEMIVFLAIMLHKAPAAFGLTTFLLHEGLERSKVKRHLLTFALSAPIMAVFTFVLLHSSGGGQKMDTLHATGIAMLFSAGTFLYVATVHVLPEIIGEPGSGGAGHSHSSASFSKCDLSLLVIGALVPLVLTLGHHH